MKKTSSRNLFNKKKPDKRVIALTQTKPEGDHELLTAEDQDFRSFFDEVLKQLPKKTSTVIMRAFDQSKEQAERLLAKSKGQFEGVFDEFLEGVDEETRRKCHSTIHSASLTAAIIGCSPIPFSDAVLLVPVQMTMMSRLHKTFGQSWAKNLGSALSKELLVVGFGRSVVGNIVKLFPGVGTLAGAAMNGLVASTITEALGWVTVKMLNDGVDLFDDVLSFKGQFNMLFKALKSSGKRAKR